MAVKLAQAVRPLGASSPLTKELKPVAIMLLEPEDLLDSISAHMDALADVVKSTLLVAVVFWWAGLRHEKVIKVFELEIPRQQALIAAIVIFIVLNILVIDKLIRLRALVLLTPDAYVTKAVTRMATHPWAANPFAYFGAFGLSRYSANKGLSALILIWWVCNSSLFTLTDDAMDPIGVLLQGAFLFLGISSIMLITKVYSAILSRAASIDQELFAALVATSFDRVLNMLLAFSIGGAFGIMTQQLTQ